VVRGDDAKKMNLRKTSDIAATAPTWRIGVGYEFLERPDGFRAGRSDINFISRASRRLWTWD